MTNTNPEKRVYSFVKTALTWCHHTLFVIGVVVATYIVTHEFYWASGGIYCGSVSELAAETTAKRAK